MDRFARCPCRNVSVPCRGKPFVLCEELGSVAVKRLGVDFRLSRPFLFQIDVTSYSVRTYNAGGGPARRKPFDTNDLRLF